MSAILTLALVTMLATPGQSQPTSTQKAAERLAAFDAAIDARAKTRPATPAQAAPMDAERQAGAAVAATQGAAIDALNAKPIEPRLEPAFGLEFMGSARDAVEDLERRMQRIDDSFQRANGYVVIPAEGEPGVHPPAPEQDAGRVRKCPDTGKRRGCPVPGKGGSDR